VQTWLEIEEFSKLIHLDISAIEEMITRGDLIVKDEDDKRLIEVDKATYSLIPTSKQEIFDNSEKNSLASGEFIEKTIGTILSLHEKVLDAKDETLEALKGENRFLKEALFSMQELYDEDRKIVETLTTQLKHTQEELEFTRRKYKLMWNKAVENYKSD
jgi:t-SNARE complex subunit (syntaxin)